MPRATGPSNETAKAARSPKHPAITVPTARKRWFDLTGKVALVTEGDHALVRAIVLALGHAGADTVVQFVREEAWARGVAVEVRSFGQRGMALRADLAVPSETEELVNSVVRECQGLDVLVHCVPPADSRSPRASSTEPGSAQWAAGGDLLLRLLRLVGHRFIAQGYGGRLITVLPSEPTRSLDGRARGAFSSFPSGRVLTSTRALSTELAPADITVNAVVPGLMESEATRGSLKPTQRSRELLARIPKGRFGRPEDIASVIVFLASDEADYLTGQTVAVDGGLLRRRFGQRAYPEVPGVGAEEG